ncbi:hypothetical protein OPKNFCMD_4511 [Methylobacterium crusticola]|uniref:T6SS Phospholipase effector Tle1-like catalytic domain-containing protein n=1 Tax=Methylobacterium crusticola TaxID=1697972 RepID=A0ABQ4R2H6_9HYPH|nr:DUF2235 domain-containing protein [Methylobacterium crusticola]GJD51753.1 hypothetical protein OPKNFCMD_4511 [Methylobacterium crusticola]
MRHIVVTIDGTSNSAAHGFKAYQTNAFRVNQALTLEDPTTSNDILLLYFSGPGSRDVPDKLKNQIFGTEIKDILRDAYVQLCMNYADPAVDKIYIFGYSRGAIIAKALTGMINRSGLLGRQHLKFLEHAYQYYMTHDRSHETFFRDKTRSVKIAFVGLFDPVLGPKNNYTKIGIPELVPDNVEHAVELLAINERRKAFKPHIWRLPDDTSTVWDKSITRNENRSSIGRLEQIWLPSCHGDIADYTCSSILTDIALLTMLERLVGRTDVHFNKSYVEGIYYKILSEEGRVKFTENSLWPRKERVIPRLATSFTHPLHDLCNEHKIYIDDYVGTYRRSKRHKKTLDALSEYNFDLKKILPDVNGDPRERVLDSVRTMISQTR